MKYIRLTLWNDTPLILNVETIESIYENDFKSEPKTTRITTSGKTTHGFDVKNTVEEICTAIDVRNL